MHSLAKTSNEMCLEPSRVYYPSIYVDDKAMSEIKDLKVGEEFSMVIKAKISSQHESEHSGETRLHADVSVMAYEMTNHDKDVEKTLD